MFTVSATEGQLLCAVMATVAEGEGEIKSIGHRGFDQEIAV